MTLQEFFQTWNGKSNNFDGVYDAQCVDLVKQYVQDVVGSPVWTGDAKDYKQNFNKTFFAYHNNDIWYVPPTGAIAVWNANVGEGHGHVGIVTSATLMSFVSFDQNWPKESPSILVNHNYKNVVGFLLPRGQDALSKYNDLVGEIKLLASRYNHLTS